MRWTRSSVCFFVPLHAVSCFLSRCVSCRVCCAVACRVVFRAVRLRCPERFPAVFFFSSYRDGIYLRPHISNVVCVWCATAWYMCGAFFLSGVGVLLLLLRPRDSRQDFGADFRRSRRGVPSPEGPPRMEHVSKPVPTVRIQPFTFVSFWVVVFFVCMKDHTTRGQPTPCLTSSVFVGNIKGTTMETSNLF